MLFSFEMKLVWFLSIILFITGSRIYTKALDISIKINDKEFVNDATVEDDSGDQVEAGEVEGNIRVQYSYALSQWSIICCFNATHYFGS